jgi:hypothetical protein
MKIHSLRGDRGSNLRRLKAVFWVLAGGLFVYNIETAGRYLRSMNNQPLASATCLTEGSMIIPFAKIEITTDLVKSHSTDRLHQLKDFTVERYEKYMTAPSGREHYALINYLSTTYGDCRHVVDVGTRYVASSLALSHSPVWTYDLPVSKERVWAFRGKSEAKWRANVRAKGGMDITFLNLKLMELPLVEFKRHMSTWLISLDTYHLPYSVPFEREFLQRLIDIEYKGIVLLDDIHLNDEMKRWWQEIGDNANNRYRSFDITKVGHSSGTGLLDFSGKVVVDSTMYTAAISG